MFKKVLCSTIAAALVLSLLASCTAKPAPSSSVSASSTPPASSTPAPSGEVLKDTKLTISKAGTVIPDSNIKEVIIEADGVVLENAKLDSVTISPKVGDGNVTLNKVTAKTLDINGGGKNSIHANGSTFTTVYINRIDGVARLVLDKASKANSVTLLTSAVLDVLGEASKIEVSEKAANSVVGVDAKAKVSDITLYAKTELKLDGNVANLVLTSAAEGSAVAIGKDSTVGTLATDVKMSVTGDGKISTAITNNRANIDSTIKVATTQIVKEPVVNGKPSDAPATAPVVPVKKPTPTPTPTPTPEPTPAPTITSITVGGVKYDYQIVENVDSFLPLDKMTVVLNYSDNTTKTIAYKDFAANGITLSRAHNAKLVHGKNEVTVKHTASGLSNVVNVMAKYDPATILTILDTETTSAPGRPAVSKISYNLKKAVKALTFTIVNNKTGDVLLLNKGNEALVGEAYFENSFRALGDISEKTTEEIATLNKRNDNRFPVGTECKEMITLVYDGVTYLYPNELTIIVDQILFDTAYYAAPSEITEALAQVNAANTPAEMQEAIEAGKLQFDLAGSKYFEITTANKTAVATAVLEAKKDEAFTVDTFRTAFDAEVDKLVAKITSITFAPSADQVVENNVAGDAITATVNVTNSTGTTVKLDWYKSTEPAKDGSGIKLISEGKAIKVADNVTSFTPPATTDAGDAHYFVSVLVTGNGNLHAVSDSVKVTTKARATGEIVITGTPKFGTTLTAGVGTSNLTGTLTYQWMVGGTDIESANAATYVPAKADIGKVINVKMGSDAQTGTLTSAAAAKVEKADGPDVGENVTFAAGEGSATPAITGTVIYEYSLDKTTWKDLADGEAITGLPVGVNTITVRAKGTDTHTAGAEEDIDVTVIAVTYEVTVSLKKDAVAYTGEEKAITLQQGTSTAIAATSSTASEFKFKVPTGTYKILVDTVDTGLTVVVKDAVASATVEFFTVTYTVKDASAGTSSDSTVAATVTGSKPSVDIANGDAVLKGTSVTITATGKNATSYTYSWNTTPPTTTSSISVVVNEKTTVECEVTGTGSALADFAFTDTDATHSLTYGDVAYTIATKDNVDKGTGAITFASADVNVATVDKASGAVTVQKAGSVVINVTKAASEGFAAVTKNYTITVEKKELTVEKGTLAIDDKIYDKTNTATIKTDTAPTLVGIVEGDEVTLTGTPTATFNTVNVDETVPVTIDATSLALDGAAKGNYKLPETITIADVTGKITAKEVTFENKLAVTTKVYDGNTVATITGNLTVSNGEKDDIVTLTGATYTGVFSNKNVGADKDVTVTVAGTPALTGAAAGNYKLPETITVAKVKGQITNKSIAIKTMSANDKVYDGNATAILKTDVVFVGLVEGDKLTVTGVTATFANENVEDGKAVTLTGTAALGGEDKGNYNLTNADLEGIDALKANITPAATVITVPTTGLVVTFADIDIGLPKATATGTGAIVYAVAPKDDAAGTLAANGSDLTVTIAGTFTINVTVAANGNYAAATSSYELVVEKGVREVPKGLNGVTPSSVDGSDGKITGLDAAKSYKYKLKAAADWTDATGATEITDLLAGTYEVKVVSANVDLWEDSTVAEVEIAEFVLTTP